jgi:predicted Zn finger-like uncharacterized protein
MSLITRCPACGTMFKVVADQLKISQGWVRCGQCSDVFDAAAHLQPRDMVISPAPAVQDANPQAVSADSTPPAPGPAPDAVAALSTLLVAPDTPTAAAPAEPPAAPLSVPEVQVSMPPDLAAEVFASSVSPDPYSLPDAAARQPADDSNLSESAAPQEPVLDVSFVRDARRQAFWRRPALRWALGGAALALLIGLLLQVALFQRDALAVRQPGLHSGLQALCGHLGCEIGPLRQIESIVIDSSSFSKLAPDAYRLRVVIKNTGSLALAMPSLELTLTDGQDQALLRRVLTPAELGAEAATLAAGAEFTGLLSIAVSNPAAAPLAASSASAASPRPPAALRIAGYRVLAFYP